MNAIGHFLHALFTLAWKGNIFSDQSIEYMLTNFKIPGTTDCLKVKHAAKFAPLENVTEECGNGIVEKGNVFLLHAINIM